MVALALDAPIGARLMALWVDRPRGPFQCMRCRMDDARFGPFLEFGEVELNVVGGLVPGRKVRPYLCSSCLPAVVNVEGSPWSCVRRLDQNAMVARAGDAERRAVAAEMEVARLLAAMPEPGSVIDPQAIAVAVVDEQDRRKREAAADRMAKAREAKGRAA